MKIINTKHLNELHKEYEECHFEDESFQEFVERTNEDGIYLAKEV